MSTPPLQQRLPFDLNGKAHPDVVDAIRYAFSGLLDLNQANAVNVASIKALKPSTSTPTTSSTTIITAGSSTTAGVTSFNAQTGAVLFFAPLGTVSNQSGETTYTTAGTDAGALIVLSDASAIAVTLSTMSPPWFCFMLNEGAGTVTVTPATGTINGNATLTLTTGQGAICFFDGTNWWAVTSGSGSAYVPQGGSTGSRPGSPTLYEVYFDTTLTQPVWWTGTTWVNSAGVPV